MHVLNSTQSVRRGQHPETSQRLNSGPRPLLLQVKALLVFSMEAFLVPLLGCELAISLAIYYHWTMGRSLLVCYHHAVEKFLEEYLMVLCLGKGLLKLLTE